MVFWWSLGGGLFLMSEVPLTLDSKRRLRVADFQ